MPQLSIYLRRDGDCRQMMEFYHRCLGGSLDLMKVKETPAAKDFPAEVQDRLMHATLRSGALVILGSDLPDQSGHRPGNDWALSLECSSEQEVKSLFEKLSDGGKADMPPATQFWGGYFAQLTDRFDVEWMLNYQPKRESH